MTTAELLLILVTLFSGPVAAVQAQKWVERAKEVRGRKLAMFHTLMATRALRAASPEHVQALNSIDLFFSAKKKKDKPVIDAWSVYLDHLNHYPEDPSTPKELETWNGKGVDFLVHLLQVFAINLGYDFSLVHLKRAIYHPRGHADILAAQFALRDMIVKLSKGEWIFPMAVREFPISPDAMKLQMEVQTAIIEAVTGKTPLKVVIEPSYNSSATKQ